MLEHHLEEPGQDPLRLFIAIDFPPEAKRQLGDFQSRLKTGARFVDAHPRWVSTANMHLTLIFLGSTPTAKLPELKSLMNEALATIAPFEIRISNLAFFPPGSKNPKVLSMDVSSEGKVLHKLHSQLVYQLSCSGWDLESRPFRPHLTLARLPSTKAASRIGPLVASHTGMLSLKFPVNEIVLFQSHLGREGPSYKALHKSTL